MKTKPLHSSNRVLTKRAVLYVGFECNARCYFCYYSHLTAEQRKWKTLSELKKECDLFKGAYRNNSVDITGGEPTIHPEILQLVKYCHGIGLQPTCISNGIKLGGKSFCREMEKAGIGDFLLSWQGHKTGFDRITGVKGHYKIFLKALGNLKELQTPFRFNVTIHNGNIETLAEQAGEMVKQKPKAINFINFNPYYKWQQCGEIDFQLSHEAVGQILSKAIDVVEEAGIECNVRYFPFCFLPERQRHVVMNWRQLSFDRHEWDFASWHKWSKKQWLSLLLEGLRRGLFAKSFKELPYSAHAFKTEQLLYEKPAKCSDCRDFFICDGLSKQYFERYRGKEVKPTMAACKERDQLYYKA